MVYVCEFCQKTFVSTSNLNFHMRTAKYCLAIQEKNEKDNQREIEYLKQIIEQKDEEIRELKEKLEKREETISSIAMKTKNIKNVKTNIVVNNHNYTLNLQDNDHIKAILDEHLNTEVLANGQRGLAKMIFDNLLKGPDGKSIYKCVDPSRHNFEYVNENGILEKDVKATKLKTALVTGDLCQKAMEVGPELWKKEDGTVDNIRFDVFSDKVLEVANIKNDDSKFRSELTVLTC